MTCPHCQAPVVLGADFCTNCGSRLSSAPLASRPGAEVSDLTAKPGSGPSVDGVDSASSPPTMARPVQPTIASMPPYRRPATASTPYTWPPVQASQSLVSESLAGDEEDRPRPLPTFGPQGPLSTLARPMGDFGPYSQPLPSLGESIVPMLRAAPSTIPLREWVGVDAPPNTPPSTPLQAALQHNVTPRYAVNLWATVTLGTVAAVGASLLLLLAAAAIWSNTLTALLETTLGGSVLDGTLVDSPARMFSPNVWQLLLLALRVPLTLGASTGGTPTSVTLTFPVTGLLVLPALALILGGYLAAASDYKRRARYSIARGALIAPFYGLFLVVVAQMAATSGGTSAGSEFSLDFAPLVAFLYGLLWGMFWGGLGGWVQLAGKHWLGSLVLGCQALRNGQLAGALAGAIATLVAVGGIGLALVLGGFVVFLNPASDMGTAASPLSPLLHGGSANGFLLSLELFLLVSLPAVLLLFMFATGASFLIPLTASSTLGLGQSTSSFGLFGAQVSPASGLVYLLVLFPLLCYVVGGRVAARTARAHTLDQAALAGALIAAPLSLVFVLCALLMTFGVSAAGGTSLAIVESVGPSVGSVALGVLILGAIGGGLGGASLAAAPALGEMPRRFLLPLRPLALVLFPLLDRLTRRRTDGSITPSRLWAYEGVLAGVTCGILTLVLWAINLLVGGVPALGFLALLVNIAAALAVALPVIFWTGALVVASTTVQMPRRPTRTSTPALVGGAYSLDPLPASWGTQTPPPPSM